ncbi:MAG: HEAT repeat domain-containing protein [Chloracidobacterium sp.]|nr:HEAT repeat domain-containing protein [Chloracidobacterium sp.]MDW8216418.1 HEAT repeat domain-containing protein [Acidobacteriota bacterium]
MPSLRNRIWLLAGLLCWLVGASAAQTPPEPPDWLKRASTLSTALGCAPELSAGLDDPHWYVRACAIQTLGQRRCAATVPALVARFDAEDWDNQARIIVALGEIGAPAGFALVARVAEGEAGTMRRLALDALGGFDAAAVEPVLIRLVEKTLTPDEKRIVVRCIARFQCRAPAAKLAEWMGNDPNLDREIALARYRTGDQSAGERIIAEFTHFDAATQRLLLEDWARQPEQRAAPALAAALQSGSAAVRLATARAWAAYGTHAPLAETLNVLPAAEAEIASLLIGALRAHPAGDVAEAVVERLKTNPPAATQTVYLKVLQALDRDVAAAALLAARSAHAPVIDQALEALGVTPEALTARLADPTLTPTARIEIALQLSQLGDARGFEALRWSFANGNGQTRRAVVEAFGRLGDARAAEPLFAALDDADPSVRTTAAATLKRLGVTPERLLHDLDSPNVARRIESLRLLGRLGDAAHVPQIAARLRKGEPLAVRLAAAAALGRLGRPEATAALTAALNASEAALRMRVVAALGEIGGEQAVAVLLPLLRDRDAELVGETIRALTKTKPPAAVMPLLAALHHPDWRVRAAAARSFSEWRDPQTPPALVGALNDASALVRFYARQALLQQGAAPHGELLAMLDRREARSWYGAYEVLRQLAPETARTALLQRLESPEPSVRATAAALLRAYRDTDTLNALLRRLDVETRFPVRWWLTRAVAEFGEAAREAVLKRARAKNPRLQADALRALGMLPPNHESRELLRAALTDPETQVRSAAVEALGRAGDVEALASLLARQAGGFTVTPDELTDALLACGEAGRAVLRQAFSVSDPAVRAVLLQRLGEDGHPDVLPLLLNALRDPSPLVRRAARQGLARQSDERAAQALAASPEASR